MILCKEEIKRATKVKKRDDGQWLALDGPTLRMEKRCVFGRISCIYQASYDERNWKKISAHEYKMLKELDSAEVDEKRWRPISEEEAKKIIGNFDFNYTQRIM